MEYRSLTRFPSEGHAAASASINTKGDSWHTEEAGTVVTINAHFDGKVIIPDEPLELPPNQPLIVRIEPVSSRRQASEESVLSWLAANAVESDALPADLGDRHDYYLYGRPAKDEKG